VTAHIVDLDEVRILDVPKPTIEQPHLMLDWLFEQRWSRVPSDSGKKNYMAALTYYKKFVQEVVGNAPFDTRQRWGMLALVQFKSWMTVYRPSDGKPLASHTVIGIMSSVRQVMIEATAIGLTASPHIANASVSSASPETEAHAPYDADELAAILEAIKKEAQYVLSVLKGYQFTGRGRDPRVLPKGYNFRTTTQQGLGWAVRDNLLWYFENEMNGVAITDGHPDASRHQVFIKNVRRYHKSLTPFYRSLGVASILDEDLLGPLLVELMYLTGLNPTSAIFLRADCLAEHPLAGVPVLRYLKKRSQGEKELFLDLLNTEHGNGGDDAQRDDAQLEPAELTLKREQAVLVQRVVDRIRQLTKPLRERPSTKDDLRDMLFIYESSGVKTHRKVMHFDLEKAVLWCQQIRDRYSLRARDGGPLTFTLVRFRPTRLTELARQGKDFFEIQHVAGHKSVRQTLAYIEQRTLDTVAQREVTGALETIWANRQEFDSPQRAGNKVIPIVPFKGLVADCRNVFDPPRQVTLAVDYVEGQACTRWNMCLLCKNVVVMVEHLALLANYRGQLVAALGNSATDLPHAALYEKSLAVLDQIFDPATSEFAEEELDAAVEASVLLDVVVDPLVYTGVSA
jgi:hypothetical protein